MKKKLKRAKQSNKNITKEKSNENTRKEKKDTETQLLEVQGNLVEVPHQF